MKKTLFLLLFLSASVAYSQCFTVPCATKVTVPGVLTNKTYTGDRCFNGAGIIESSVSITGWAKLTFSGALVIQPDIMMPGSGKMYADFASVLSFNRIQMNGRDTMYIGSDIVISSLFSENCDSTYGNTNVIMLANSIHGITIGNRYYRPGDIYHINTEKYVKILNCYLRDILPINDVKINSVKRLKEGSYQIDFTVDATGNETKTVSILFTDTDGKERVVNTLVATGQKNHSITVNTTR